MSDLSFWELFDGYSQPKDNAEGKKFISKTVTGSFAGKHNHRFLHIAASFTARFKSIISYTSVRCYGLMLLAFGLVTLLIHFAKDYLGVYEAVPLNVLIIGAITAIVGIFAVVFDKPLTVFLQDFPLTDYIFFEFFCIKRSHRRADERGAGLYVGLIVGILLASLGAAVPFVPLVLSLLGVVYLFLAFLSPEFSLFSTFLILPYLSLINNHEMILAGFVSVNLLSFIRKVMLGKRVYYLEQYDICLAVFLVFVLISGIFVKGVESFTSSVVMIILASGYILSGSIIANRRLADCLINALIISSVPVSVLACVQFGFAISNAPYSEFSGVSATFSSPEVLAAFLVLSLVFSYYFIHARRRRSAKLLYGFIALITFAAIFFTYNAWAIVIALVLLPAYLVVRNHRVYGITALLVSLLISLVFFIPDAWLNRLSEFDIFAPLKLSEYAERWQYVRHMLVDNIFAGVGIGRDCFIEEMKKYSTDAVFTDGGSFFLEVALEAGIFALFTLIVVILIRIRHIATYIPYVKNSQLNAVSRFTSFALAAFICLGAFNYLWADMSVYFIFWCVFGVGSDCLRISKQEHDDRIGYYSDGRSSDSSSVDIDIR